MKDGKLRIYGQGWTRTYLQLAGLQRAMPTLADQHQGVIQVTYLQTL
jgi:hypothetical protein